MKSLFIDALGNYSQLNLAKGSSSTSITGGAIVAVLSAILGFVSAYAISQIQRRREPRKQLSWELQTEEVQLEVSSEIKERVGVLYRDTRVQNLTAVACQVSNTGNRVVKNEQVRFNFGDQAQVLEHSLYPPPEPELDAAQIDDHGLTDLDFVYRIGQLEIGQQVRFLFVLAGPNPIVSPAPHAKNEEGDVQFIRRGTERIVADQEHLRPFFVTLFAFLVVPLIISPLSGEFGFDFGGAILAAVRVVLLIPLLPHIAPIARLAQQLVVHYLSVDKGASRADNGIFGGEFNGPVIQGRNMSDFKFSPPEQPPDESVAG
jgi:hypothetical protein